MTPIVKFLRLCDGEMPVMGKVYDRMFMLVENTKASGVPWASSAVTAIEKRWEYLHSDMHSAGYAFDPEFMANANQWDEHVAEGVLKINEKLRLVPGHCDPTCNVHDWYVGVRNGKVETLWPVSARGKAY